MMFRTLRRINICSTHDAFVAVSFVVGFMGGELALRSKCSEKDRNLSKSGIASRRPCRSGSLDTFKRIGCTAGSNAHSRAIGAVLSAFRNYWLVNLLPREFIKFAETPCDRVTRQDAKRGKAQRTERRTVRSPRTPPLRWAVAPSAGATWGVFQLPCLSVVCPFRDHREDPGPHHASGEPPTMGAGASGARFACRLRCVAAGHNFCEWRVATRPPWTGLGRGGNPWDVHVQSCHASVSGNSGHADIPAGALGVPKGVASGDGVFRGGSPTARCGRDSSSRGGEWRKPRVSGRDAKPAAASGVAQPVACGLVRARVLPVAGLGRAQGQVRTPNPTAGNASPVRHPHLSPGFRRKSLP